MGATFFSTGKRKLINNSSKKYRIWRTRQGLESPGRAGSKESSLECFRQTFQDEMATRQQGNELGGRGKNQSESKKERESQ
eukprot:scaffold25440_cov31-Attheya_sp.AAC.4